ncbi:Ca-activated chloride channel family protein [Sphingomonas zeicaulis]|uniref:vWA domain-containing protein n=1 Tax=Sphingomonas zeicaulis TaxID=1632740 RepID=UPI003D2633BE
MPLSRRLSLPRLLLSLALMLPAPAVLAQEPPPQEEEQDFDDIVVTSMRVRQGGAQDVRHFRKVALEAGIPQPDSLTVEGLMGEHDLTIATATPCKQLFCLATEAMPAALPGRPDDRLFVGLGFGSNIDADKWRREPLNLVAVVDKSGSMDGQPLDLVRKSLRQIAGQMRAGDRIAIVLYGDESHVWLKPTDVGRDRAAVFSAIDGIKSEGSTNMEEGLQVGYETAFADAAHFKGNTRVMLFTDEQPNVGSTDAGSFMGMALDASRRGIGLTTIGVGLQFDADLATTISSVRGGNLFFIGNADEVKDVFARQLDTMVSELAHDVVLTMVPTAGYSITGVFGVPDGLMREGKDGAIAITVPTAFLSTNGGGIFVSLGKESARAHLPAAALDAGAPLMRVDLSYVGAADGKAGRDSVTVAAPAGTPSAALRSAQMLVDEYLSMQGATEAYHSNNDPKTAYALLAGLDKRLAASGLTGLEGERTLVGKLLEQTAFYAGYSSERPKSLSHLGVIGDWRIISAEGFEDLRRGDQVSFSDDEEFTVVRAKPRRGEEEEDYESYEINERQIHLPESKLVMTYRTDRDRLYLNGDDAQGRLRLVMARLETE